MANVVQARKLMEVMRTVALQLTDDEVSAIAKILNRATDRLLDEQVPKNCYLYDSLRDVCYNEDNCKAKCPRRNINDAKTQCKKT